MLSGTRKVVAVLHVVAGVKVIRLARYVRGPSDVYRRVSKTRAIFAGLFDQKREGNERVCHVHQVQRRVTQITRVATLARKPTTLWTHQPEF